MINQKDTSLMRSSSSCLLAECGSDFVANELPSQSSSIPINPNSYISGSHSNKACDAPWTAEQNERIGRSRYKRIVEENKKRKRRNCEIFLESEKKVEHLESLLSIKPRLYINPKIYEKSTRKKIIPDNLPIRAIDIIRSPIKCPTCGRTISPSGLLQHFFSYHLRNKEVEFIEMYERHRCVVFFAPQKAKMDVNKALVLLLFGGYKTEHGPMLKQTLIKRKLAISNTNLGDEYTLFLHHFPILLMACHTTWSAAYGQPNLKTPASNTKTSTSDIWVIWALSAQTIKPLYITVTAFDALMTTSMSRLLRVRTTTQSQLVNEFMRQDFNCLILNFANIRELTNNFRNRMRLEVLISENIASLPQLVISEENLQKRKEDIKRIKQILPQTKYPLQGGKNFCHHRIPFRRKKKNKLIKNQSTSLMLKMAKKRYKRLKKTQQHLEERIRKELTEYKTLLKQNNENEEYKMDDSMNGYDELPKNLQKILKKMDKEGKQELQNKNSGESFGSPVNEIKRSAGCTVLHINTQFVPKSSASVHEQISMPSSKAAGDEVPI